MKFYSKIINKPHSIIEETKKGNVVTGRKKLCIFYDGVLETDDQRVIAKLQTRKDLFRTDRPWTVNNWRNEEDGIKLIEQGEKLGIDCRHIRESYLRQLIAQKNVQPVQKKEKAKVEVEKVETKDIEIPVSKPTTKVVKIDYKELMKIAKDKGINGFGKKKKELEKILKGKGVI